MMIQHARIDGVSNQQRLSTLPTRASAIEKMIIGIASRCFTLLADFLMYFVSERACRSYLAENSWKFAGTAKEVLLAAHILRKMGPGAPRDPTSLYFYSIFPFGNGEDGVSSASSTVTQGTENVERPSEPEVPRPGRQMRDSFAKALEQDGYFQDLLALTKRVPSDCLGIE
ncbi:MAG: hypothetical protein AAGI90_04270 [Chlamydiota bacterium]